MKHRFPFIKSWITTLVLSVALICSLTATAQEYEGAEFCGECHETQYSSWKASGHPYKLMRGEDAMNRPIPLPAGVTWGDVSYVIGGYKWKARYMDNEGYIITSVVDPDLGPIDGQNQYNYFTDTWSDYHPGEMKPYNCGSCHTTGWVADEDFDTDNDLTDNQDGLPGIHGTFEFGGVLCEQCHGPGFASMAIDDSSAACGACHVRGDPNTIPAKGGFVRHHEQYNELLASPHAALRCVSCHNPHKRSQFSIETACADCHPDTAASYAATSMADYDVTCEDCHMPFATKSAQALGEFQGDVMTHLFSINTDPTASMFTEDGGFVALDSEGKGAVTLDFVCKRCHQQTDMGELAKFASSFHSPDFSNIGLNPGLSGTWWNAERSGEGFLFDFAFSNGQLFVFASFYTYDPMGNQAWLVAQGPVTGGNSVDVDVFITEGRQWGDDFDPNAGSTVAWGQATFTFTGCGAGDANLSPNQDMQDMGYTALTYGLTRDLLESKIQCPSFVNNPGLAVR